MLTHPTASDPAPVPRALASSDRVAAVLILAAVGAYAVQAAGAILASRHLYGDAAWFLARLASDGRPYRLADEIGPHFYQSRAVALWLTQGPAALALRAGVRSLPAVSIVLGCSYYFWKLASLALCWRLLARGEKLLVVFPALGLFAGSINSDPYIVSEVHVAVALFWPILLGIRREAPRSAAGDAALGLAILASALVHEVFALLAAAMLAAVAWRARPGGGPRDARAPWLTGLLALSVAMNALGILSPRDPTQRGAFAAGLAELARDTAGGLSTLHPGPVLSVIAVVAVLCVAFAGGGEPRGRRRVAVAGTALLLAAGPFLYRRAVPETRFEATAAHDRGFSGGVMQLVLMAAFLAVDRRRCRERFERRAVAVAAIVGALAAGQLTLQVHSTREWRSALADLRRRLDAGTGLLTCPDATASLALGRRPPADALLCRWWVTPLSMVLARDGVVRSLMLSDDAFQHLDPRNPAELPSLRFVRGDYRPYLAALGTGAALGPRDRVAFGAGGRGVTMLREGFSAPEPGGVWTDGDRAVLRACELDRAAGADPRLAFRVRPFAPPGGPMPEAAISAGGAPAGVWRFSPGEELVEREVAVPRAAIAPDGCVGLEFRIRGASSPAAHGLSGDVRRLGLLFFDLRLRAREADAAASP